MQVVNITSPANYFHVLRRQIRRNFRKPLIVMTPKSLLRHKRCVSRLADMGPGTTFHRVLWDDAQDTGGLVEDAEIRRVMLCSGKVYYDLLEERDKRELKDVYLLRMEQIYPFPVKALTNELSRFPAADVAWCQEEPKNMGAWFFVNPLIEEVMTATGMKAGRPIYAGRAEAASPATGLARRHQREQAKLVDEALTLPAVKPSVRGKPATGEKAAARKKSSQTATP